MMENAICRNCEKPLQSHYAYCPYCSQKAALHRLSMHEVMHEAIHYFTHADKGFFQLIRDLAIKNGHVAKEYMDGKRKKYFPPLNFFLLAAAIYVFVAGIQHDATVEKAIHQMPEKIAAIKDPAKQLAQFHIYQRKLKVGPFMEKYANLYSMVALPLVAFFFWVFYRKAKFNYTEHLVANMYMSGFIILISSLVLMPIINLLDLSGIITAVAFFVIQLLYFPVFYYRFLEKRSIGAGFKAVLVSITAILSWYVVSFTAIGIYIANGFWGMLS